MSASATTTPNTVNAPAQDDKPKHPLGDLLRRSGVWVDTTTYDGVTHGFFGLYQIVNKAMFAQGQLARNLNAAFGG